MEHFTAPPSSACGARPPTAGRWPSAATARSPWATSSSRARRARCASSTTARCWPALPAPRPMPSPCSSASRPSWKSTRATWCARPSSSPRTGAPTACCAGWRPCWRWPTARPRSSSPATATCWSPSTASWPSAPAAPTPRRRPALLDNTELPARRHRAQEVAGDRRRAVHLHQHAPHHRDALNGWALTMIFASPCPMTPQEIVSELDRHIVGQHDAKRAVAIALRNRWRRQQVDEKLRGEITPKNILMIGPTGVGKTEIARRLARLADAPFIKVEATKFTEVGYVGKDVDSIIRDLAEVAVKQTREPPCARCARAPRTPPRSASWTCCCRRARGDEHGRRRRQHRAPGVPQEAARGPARRQGDRDRTGRAAPQWRSWARPAWKK
jgi:hypothetical protein